MALTANDKDNARAYLVCIGSVLEAVASDNEDGALQILRDMVGGDEETFDQALSAHEALASVVTANSDEDYDEDDEDDEDPDEDDEDESDDDEDYDEDEDDEDPDEDEDDEDESDDDEDYDEDEDEGGEADLTTTASVSRLNAKERRTRAALISVASQGIAYEDPTHVTASEEDEEDEPDEDEDEDELGDIDVPDKTVTARVQEARKKRQGTTASVAVKKKKSNKTNPGGFL